MNSYILLDDLRFHAYHGVGEQEKLVGNEFRVDLRIRTNIREAMKSDDVTDTVSYAEVYETVKEEMERPSQLLEHVAGRIAQRLFKEFPQIDGLELKVKKRNPPMGADIASAGVELSLDRLEDFLRM